MKRCNRCGKVSDLFSSSATSKDGLRATCNTCLSKPDVLPTVKSSTVNKLAGNYKPEKNIHYREVDNKKIKSRGSPC